MTTQHSGFVPGTVYYGSLSVAHGYFPVRCVRRTDKSVWFEHVTMAHAYPGPKRAKIHTWADGSESARAWCWYVSSDSADRYPAAMFDPTTI
jgi:hypothetical protein